MVLYSFNASATCWNEHAYALDDTVRVVSGDAPLNGENNFEPSHAVALAALTTEYGVVTSRIVDNGHRVELALLNTANAPECPAALFAFPDAVLQTGLTLDHTTHTLLLLALTASGKLFKLAFSAQHLWFDEEWQDHVFEVQLAAGENVRGLHVLDADAVLVACKDGSLIKLTQARADTESGALHEDSWTDVTLAVKAGWGLWPIRRATDPNESDPSCAVSFASVTNQASMLDVAFTLSRDRKLRIWSLQRDRLINTFDLSQLLSAALPSVSVNTDALYADRQQPLLRVFPSDDLADPYAAYLIIHTPHSGTQSAFLAFAITLGDSGEVETLVPVGARNAPPSLSTAELVDFQVAKLDITLTNNPPLMTLWSLWHIAGVSQLVFTSLPEVQNQSTEPAEPAWIPVLPAYDSSVAPELFDQQIAALSGESAPSRDLVAQVFGKYIFEPGRYAPSTLLAALNAYTDSIEPVVELDELATLADRITATVGGTVQLVNSTTTGAPLLEDYVTEIKAEWCRFLAMLNEVKTAALFPLALTCDAKTQAVYLHARAAVAVPLVQEEALTLRRQIEQPSGIQDFLRIPQHLFTPSYPLLSPLTTREPILHLAAIAKELFAALPLEVALQIEAELVSTVCKPLLLAAEDVATDLYDRVLQNSLTENREELIEKMRQVPNLTEGLSAYLQLLSSRDWAGFPNTLEGGGTPSKLGVGFACAAVQQGTKVRYTAALELLVLLLAAFSEEEDLFPESSKQLNSALSSFHALHLLKWLSENANVPTANQDAETSTDALSRRFGGLGVQNKLPPSDDAASLLGALLSDLSYMPFLSPGPSTSLLQAVSYFLGHIELLPASQAAESKIGLTKLSYRLLEVGLAEQALKLVDMLAPQDEGLAYVAGRALLELGEADNAVACIKRASIALQEPEAITSLSSILPQQLCQAVPYFFHSALLFSEQPDTEVAVAQLCRAALQHVARGEAATDENIKELWSLLFKAYVSAEDFENAFAALVDMPLADLQSDSLRLFITALSDISRMDVLLQFPFPPTLRNELETQLEFRARNTDPRAVPCFSKVLYSFHVSRGDFRKAATVMYLHARRLGEAAIHDDEFQYLITERCQAYLAAINALSLIDAVDAWIACPFPSRRKRTVRTATIPEEAFSKTAAPELSIYDLVDLQQEYVCTLARLELAPAYPELSRATTDLDAASAVALYSQIGRYEKAFATAFTCDLSLQSLFENLTSRCLGFSKDPNADSTWVFEVEEVAKWVGSVESKAWRLLERYLDRYDRTGAYREKVLDLILTEEVPVLVPTWLSSYFQAHNADLYGRKLYEFGFVDEALRFAQHQLEVSKAKGRKTPALLSWTLVDQLLEVQSEHDGPVDMELQKQLREAVAKGNGKGIAG